MEMDHWRLLERQKMGTTGWLSSMHISLPYVAICMYVRTYVRTYVRMYVCMYVCMYICCRVKKWATVCPLLGQRVGHIFPFLLFCVFRIVFFLQGERGFEKKTELQKHFENKMIGSMSGPHVSNTTSPNVAHLLTQPWPTCWPNFLHPNIPRKQCPKLVDTLVFIVFSKKHTYKQQKQKKQNTIIFTFGNIIAPFDFDRKLFHFWAPSF